MPVIVRIAGKGVKLSDVKEINLDVTEDGKKFTFTHGGKAYTLGNNDLIVATDLKHLTVKMKGEHFARAHFHSSKNETTLDFQIPGQPKNPRPFMIKAFGPKAEISFNDTSTDHKIFTLNAQADYSAFSTALRALPPVKPDHAAHDDKGPKSPKAPLWAPKLREKARFPRPDAHPFADEDEAAKERKKRKGRGNTTEAAPKTTKEEAEEKRAIEKTLAQEYINNSVGDAHFSPTAAVQAKAKAAVLSSQKFFKRIDTDHDDIISVDELKNALKNKKGEIGAEEFKGALALFDVGGDGKISRDEIKYHGMAEDEMNKIRKLVNPHKISLSEEAVDFLVSPSMTPPKNEPKDAPGFKKPTGPGGRR